MNRKILQLLVAVLTTAFLFALTACEDEPEPEKPKDRADGTLIFLSFGGSAIVMDTSNHQYLDAEWFPLVEQVKDVIEKAYSATLPFSTEQGNFSEVFALGQNTKIILIPNFFYSVSVQLGKYRELLLNPGVMSNINIGNFYKEAVINAVACMKNEDPAGFFY